MMSLCSCRQAVFYVPLFGLNAVRFEQNLIGRNRDNLLILIS